MKTVYKFPFEIDDEVHVKMPGQAEVVMIDCQNGQPTMWAIVDTDGALHDYRFILRGTGHPLPEYTKHVGSFCHGPFVWHVFQ